jgi:hypothetical protein
VHTASYKNPGRTVMLFLISQAISIPLHPSLPPSPHRRSSPEFVNSVVTCLMRHGVDVISPSSWEPQEERMMSTVANFSSVRNQGMSNPGKSQTQEDDAC